MKYEKKTFNFYQNGVHINKFYTHDQTFYKNTQNYQIRKEYMAQVNINNLHCGSSQENEVNDSGLC